MLWHMTMCKWCGCVCEDALHVYMRMCVCACVLHVFTDHPEQVVGQARHESYGRIEGPLRLESML